jgi:hypothetical protein
MRSTAVVAAAGFIFAASIASAQSIEVGAGVSLSCEPLESSWCHRRLGNTGALYGSWWATDSLAIELRGAHLAGPASRIVAVGEQIGPHEWFYRSYAVRDERRTLLQGSVVYHFLDKRPVRPFVGGGPGILWWAADATCPRELIDCQRVLPEGRAGRLSHSTWVLSVVGGVAVHAWRGLTLRGGVRGTSHPVALWRLAADADRPPNHRADELSEYFGSVGYRW